MSALARPVGRERGPIRRAAKADAGEEVRLPVPVRVCHPYARALMAGANPGADVNPEVPRGVRAVEVTLGAFPVTPEVTLIPVSPAFPTTFRPWPPGHVRQVLLTRRVALPTEVVVLDYGVTKPG